MAKKSAGKSSNKSVVENDVRGCFHDVLNVARLLSSSATPEQVIETVLVHLCERLGKRTRCAFLEGDDLRLKFWAGEYTCPIGGVQISKDSVVWDVMRKGTAINLTKPHQGNGYVHTLDEPITIKAIIPLSYTDAMSQEEKKVGALIVDSGKKDVPISNEDFEYLQVIGQLLSAILGRAELIKQLVESCRRQEAILKETVHNFRNRIVVIGGFSRHISRLAQGSEMAQKAMQLQEEVKSLEAHLAVFEKYMQ